MKINVITIVSILVVLILVLVIAMISDAKKNYNIKIRSRVLTKSTGQKSTYYVTYWLWQPNKKRQAIAELERLGVGPIYCQHAQRRHKLENSKIPFRRECFGSKES
ncbi:hypothetical protein PT287_01970 [Lactobacillus sp. ESL0679]|uniref:hypothetical protein n=1 Tax=Lactobacillus sp. ESL0679 TaxID=2983209 RepID=UPI0023FA09E4|nr:hypothetical protein [Lactobacillus sp. ESL0679]MDF7682289.1 hypothetical protein [Lactobacillus sp. ESL0679]